MYTNLGDDAVVHALNETGVSIVITSHELLPRFKKMLNRLPNISTIVYMEDQLQKTAVVGYQENVNIKAFRQIVATGADHPEVVQHLLLLRIQPLSCTPLDRQVHLKESS